MSMQDRPFQLFEISWEVCNKVGGIHTVLTSKAKYGSLSKQQVIEEVLSQTPVPT